MYQTQYHTQQGDNDTGLQCCSSHKDGQWPIRGILRVTQGMFVYPSITFAHFPHIQGLSQDDAQLEDLTCDEMHMWIDEHEIVAQNKQAQKKGKLAFS